MKSRYMFIGNRILKSYIEPINLTKLRIKMVIDNKDRPIILFKIYTIMYYIIIATDCLIDR